MKHGSTLFLRMVVYLLGLVVLTLCILIAKILITVDVGGYKPILIGMLTAAIPFFIGVFQTLKLLDFIDHKKAFTNLAVKSLGYLKYCGILISLLFGIGLPYIIMVAERDDAPGVVMLGLIFTTTPLVIGVFAAVFQKLLQNAINLKSENELTV